MRYRLNLDRLTQILGESKVSQNHWAIRLGLSRGHWSDIVNGKHPYPSAKTRQVMTDVLGAHAADLFIAESGPGAPDPDFRIAISGRFELTGEIGQGGMGTVYHANDLALGRCVALKAVSAEAIAGVGADELLKEIRVVARLHHPHILPLFDAGAGAQRPYFVMPFIRGGSLRARLESEGRLPLAEVTAIVRALASALDHAHAQQVLHCDIKPENVLLDGTHPYLHPYLMDFGIARTLHAEADAWAGLRKELDVSAGTPAYVSPEQAAGEPDLDARSDVFSLACLTYEMLGGRIPFEGRNTQEIVARRFSEMPPSLATIAPELPLAVADVVAGALAVDRDKRPASAGAFAAALAAASSAPVRATSRARALALAPARWVRRRILGSAGRTKRRSRRDSLLSSLWRELAYSVRQRRRAPGLTVTSLLTIALGIGLSVSVFALVDGVVLRPLPFAGQDRLVALESVDSLGQSFPAVSSANWHDWRTGSRTLAGAAIYQNLRASVVAGDDAFRVNAAWVSAEFPSVLGMRLHHGRTFDSTEVADGAGGALVSEAIWRDALGASLDPSLTIAINGERFPVIGVVAAGQEYPAGTGVWTPYRHRQVGGQSRNNVNWRAVARLADDASIEGASAELATIAARIHQEDPVALYSYGVGVRPLRAQLVGDATGLLSALTAAVAVVLLVSCANLAGANLAQGEARLRELAVRAALGASRGRLVRQVVVDHLGIAIAGGAMGTLLAFAIVRSTAFIAGSNLPRLDQVRLSPTVLAVAIGLSLLTGLATALLPALQVARLSPNEAIGGGSRSVATGGRGLPGRALVAAQVAMALVLVTAASLLVLTLRTIVSRPLGFETRAVATARVSLGGPRYPAEGEARHNYWEALTRTLRETPGIRDAALAGSVPIESGSSGFIEVDGVRREGAAAAYRIVSDRYFATLGIGIRAGRDFEPGDLADGLRVVIVNASFAEAFWPGEGALGRRVRALSHEPFPFDAPAQWLTVIGVVDDIRHFGHAAEAEPEMYVLHRQLPGWRLASLTAIVRGAGAEESLLGAVRETVRRVDPTMPADLGLMDDLVRRDTATERFAMIVFEAFGALALLLAAIGLYGVLSYSIARRGRELAVRAALGASRGSLLGLVVRDGARVTAIGLGVGLAGVWAGGRFIESLLFGVTATDPAAIGGAAAVVLLASSAAIALPALRATRADPVEALRGD